MGLELKASTFHAGQHPLIQHITDVSSPRGDVVPALGAPLYHASPPPTGGGVLLVTLVQHFRHLWFQQDCVVYLYQVKERIFSEMLSFENGEIITPPSWEREFSAS